MSIAQTHDHAHDHERLHARERLQAWLKTVILLGLGLYFGWTILSENLSNYINARFAWLAYVATAVFFLLGLMSVWSLLRRSDDDAHHHDHDHGMSWGTLVIVAVPLILGTLIPSRPLGADAIEGNISTTGVVSAGDVQAFNVAPLERNVLDWLRVFNAAEDFGALNGLPADVIGFVYREPTFAEDKFLLARYAMSCCVADASALGLPAQWASTANLTQGQWVRVQGEFQLGEFRGDMLPVLRASSVEVVEEPAHPYLYP